MKKTMIFLLMLGCAFVHAQVSQDKQFSGVQMIPVNLSSTYYFNVDVVKSQVIVYKENYSLLNTFTLSLPAGYTLSSVILTDKVFNSTTDLEFLATVAKTNGTGTDADMAKLLLYNEKGQQMYDFGAGTIITSNFIKTISGSSKMIVYRMIYDSATYSYTTNTDFYTVTGNYSGLSNVKESDNLKVFVDEQKRTIEFLANENPSNWNLELFDSRGTLVKEAFSNSTDGRMTISSFGLTAGVYVYRLNGYSGKLLIK